MLLTEGVESLRRIAHPEKALPGASIAIAKEDKFVKYLFNQENADGYAKGKSITETPG